jgi:hypothetical protein
MLCHCPLSESTKMTAPRRQCIDDLIDVLVWIRWMYPKAREHEIKVEEVTV